TGLLGELYRNDPEWGQDEIVRTGMVNIIGQLSAMEGKAVSDIALTLLKEFNQDQGPTTRLLYPLRSRLPLPASSPLLTRVQAIPDVEYDLHKLRLQRLGEHRRGVYIPPQAKPSLQAGNDMLFPLMEKVHEFLAGRRQVFLVLGDSGAGKSTFNLELEHVLWKGYKKRGPIPLYINLPTIDDPAHDLIEKQLQYLNFSNDQIQEMKLHRHVVLICDGYDESQLKVNLHATNNFNQLGQWKVKMVISCRTQYLGQDYRSRFLPHSADRYQPAAVDLFQEAVVAAFSRTQIQQYVEEYVKGLPSLDPLLGRPSWTAEEYMEKLVNIPNLLDLVSNPFLLSLSLDALPSVVNSHKDLSAIRITRVQLYDSFVKRWLEVNRARLEQSPLSELERSELDLLVEDNFLYHGTHFQKDLATAIFIKHTGNPVVPYTHLRDKGTWKAAFFAPEGQAKLLRESSTVMRTGTFFRFLHRSLLEYFYSRTIYDPRDYDSEADSSDDRERLFDFKTCLAQKNLVEEPSILQFLADRASQDLSFKQQLLDAIEESKADKVEEAVRVAAAAANAISILVRAGEPFNGADLRGVKIPDADLSNGQFDSAQFQGADLTGANLSKCWLRQADLSNAQLEGGGFGELPDIETGNYVTACAYSPDGRMLAFAAQWEDLCLYDTSTWTMTRQFPGSGGVKDIAFSPDSLRILSGGYGDSVRTWDCTSGEELVFMHGHTSQVTSVGFSPCGKQIASAGYDNTVRLWDSQTGESLLVLKGHTDGVMSVKYSPKGHQLVSGSMDGTIRFWDPETGEPGAVLDTSLEEVCCLAFSPDGRWVASGHDGGEVEVWDAVTGELISVLPGHTENVTAICFSPDGQWIASSSDDYTVKLWDASTNALVAVLTGHNNYVGCIAFSSDGRQIASGGYERKVRLWEVGSNWSGLDPQVGSRAIELAYSCDGRSLLSYDERGIFRRWDAATGSSAPIPLEIPKQREITSRAYALDGSHFAFGYWPSRHTIDK
ncbi:WD_REPEATS_REGION domain-containing protein, partial [Mortierella sp. 14UC]